MTVLRVASTASFVQLVEFGLLKRMSEEGIESVIVGSTAAYTYGLNVEPRVGGSNPQPASRDSHAPRRLPRAPNRSLSRYWLPGFPASTRSRF